MTSMNGFEKRAQRIKEKIMNTTADLLRTTDPKKLRVADIAKEAHVSQVTIYNYFGSKEILFREVFMRFVDQSAADFEAYLSEGHSLKETIAHILVLEKESYSKFPPKLIQDLINEDDELRRYVEELYRTTTVPLTMRMLQEGKERGEISEEVSVENVLLLMQLYKSQYDLILGMAQQSKDMDRFLEGMVHMFFYGICGKP